MRGSAATDAPASARVVQLVAEREAVDATRLDPPLNDVIDPDALDALFADTTVRGSIRFEYCGYTVHVDSDGTVELTDRFRTTRRERTRD
jgi:hypothetical protein